MGFKKNNNLYAKARFSAFKRALKLFDNNASSEIYDLVEKLNFAFFSDYPVQEVDISLASYQEKIPIRFSISDISCVGKLWPFFHKYISSCGKYPIDIVSAFSNIVLSAVPHAKFSFGVQWTNEPIFKAYFEGNLSNLFLNKDKRSRLFTLFNLPDKKFKKEDVPTFLCVDFCRNFISDFKVYVLRDTLEYSPHFYTSILGGSVYEEIVFPFPMLHSTKPLRYFVMESLLGGRKKIYVSYPLEIYKNPEPDIFEICKMLASIGEIRVLHILHNLCKIANEKKCTLIPTSYSYECKEGKPNIIVYVRFV